MADVCQHRRFINGPEIDELESRLAAMTGAGECVAVASGTDALLIALLGEDIGTGQAVFLPALTYIATAGAVRLAGATPVCVDVAPDTLNMDPEDLERRITRVRRAGVITPRAVIPVDLFGLPADYAALRDVARRHGLFMLADAAQSLGGEYNGRAVGALADATATSFYPTKPLGCYGDGGALFTDQSERAERWRAIRVHGFPAGEKLQATRLGLNGRLDTLQAAVLLAKLDCFAAERERREMLAGRYDQGLDDVVRIPARREGVRSAWAAYTVRHPRRDVLRSGLADGGVDSMIYYPRAVHEHKAFADLAPAGGLPVAETAAREVLSLPLHADLTDDEADRVVTAVRTACGDLEPGNL